MEDEENDESTKLFEEAFFDNQIDPENLRKLLKYMHTTNLLTAQNQANQLSELLAQLEQSKLQSPTDKEKPSNVCTKFISISNAIETLKNKNSRLQCLVERNTKLLEKYERYQSDKSGIKPMGELASCFQIDAMNYEVCMMKKNYFKLENQIRELFVKTESLDCDIEEIREKIKYCYKIPQIEENVIKLLDWRAALREEIDALTERYEYLKTVKVSRNDVEIMIENKVDYKHLEKYVTKCDFNLVKQEFIKEFDELKELLFSIQVTLTTKLVDLHKEVQRLYNQIASKRRCEKRSIVPKCLQCCKSLKCDKCIF